MFQGRFCCSLASTTHTLWYTKAKAAVSVIYYTSPSFDHCNNLKVCPHTFCNVQYLKHLPIYDLFFSNFWCLTVYVLWSSNFFLFARDKFWTVPIPNHYLQNLILYRKQKFDHHFAVCVDQIFEVCATQSFWQILNNWLIQMFEIWVYTLFSPKCKCKFFRRPKE